MEYTIRYITLWICICIMQSAIISGDPSSYRTQLAYTLHAIYEQVITSDIENRCNNFDEHDELAISKYPVAYTQACQLRNILQNSSCSIPLAYIRAYYRTVHTATAHIPFVLALEQRNLQRGVIQSPFQHKLNRRHKPNRYPHQSISSQDVAHLYRYTIPMLTHDQYESWKNTVSPFLSKDAQQLQEYLRHHLTQRTLSKDAALENTRAYIQLLRKNLNNETT